jgi:hypothetical protein
MVFSALAMGYLLAADQVMLAMAIGGGLDDDLPHI